MIALVITIIILLILSAIGIATLTGDNGILNKAKDAKEKTEISSALEEINIAIMEEQIRAETGENLGNQFNYENVWETLRKEDNNLKVTEIEKDKSYEIIYKGYLFQIDGNKKVTYIGKGEHEENPGQTQYTIIYHKNDGTEEKIEQVVEQGKEIILETSKFTRGGYQLEGWYTNSDCTSEKIIKVSDNIEVYAKWIVVTTVENEGSTTIGNITYIESYNIYNKTQLTDFRDKVNNGKNFENCLVRQVNNINLDSESWTPIGNETNYFSGTYEATKHKVEGINVNNSTNNQGLFGYIKNATIKNVVIENGVIKGNNNVGGICGYNNASTISECENNATMTISGNNNIGGICGYSNASTINNCNNKATITGNSNAGGVCGQKENGTINNCYNEGAITSTGYYSITIFFGGTTHTENHSIVGGIVGLCTEGNVSNCKNKGKLNSTTNLQSGCMIGGIVGEGINNCTISKCSNLVSIKPNNYVEELGGIAGYVNQVTIEESYNIGDIEGKGGAIAGIVGGMTYTTVKNCYNIGSLLNRGTGDYSRTGGIIGAVAPYKYSLGYEYFYNSYSMGTVTGATGYTDPLVGEASYLTYKYIYILKSVYTQDGKWENCTGDNFDIFEDTDSIVIKNAYKKQLLNENGANKWTTGGKNNGYPYLINNIPE